MSYMIVSGNKPSSVTLHQNHVILFIEMLLKKIKILVLNLIIPKIKNNTISKTCLVYIVVVKFVIHRKALRLGYLDPKTEIEYLSPEPMDNHFSL